MRRPTSLPDGSCVEVFEGACDDLGGDFGGSGSVCGVAIESVPLIPLPGDPIVVTDTIVVTDSFPITDVDVEIEIDHTYIQDLIISLQHVPTGTTVKLWDRQCSDEDGLIVTFDDL